MIRKDTSSLTMARGSGQAHGATPTSKSKSRKEIHGLNTAYRDMLAEAEAEYSSAQTGDEERPLKRRRVRGKIVAEEEHRAGDASSPGTVQKPPFEQQAVSKQRRELAPSDDKTEAPMTDSIDDPIQQGQVIYKDGVSDESDFAWEEVDLAQEADQSVPDPADGDDEQDLDLVLDADGKQRPDQAAAMRRKVLTAAEKRVRLEVHKVHILCLLFHVHLRNHWCNDQNVHVCNQYIDFLWRRLSRLSENTISSTAKAYRFTPES